MGSRACYAVTIPTKTTERLSFMLPNTVVDALVEGDLDGETVKMEIDASATAHIMSVLTDLYSDRLMAIVREYATNARDAHIEAGVSRPIEITLPSRMSSYYHVKDYGIGLDVEGIRNIYSKYGASTKRGSNDFNGMLGLGCKSAMTYAAQFSIISVKDGMKYNVSVSRAADGVGEMQVIDQTPTSEPNGVEIVVPIKSNDVFSIASKVASFFQWWPEGSVLVNGTAPKRFEGRKVAKNLYMVDGLEKDLIIMGNVPYPVPFEDGIYAGEKDAYGYNRKSFGVVYFAEMGDVTFSPSRESLQTTRNTRATVDLAKDLFIKNLKDSLQQEVDALPSPVEAMQHYRRIRTRYRDIDVSDLTYKGHVFESSWEAPFVIKKTQPVAGFSVPRDVKNYDYFFWYDADGGKAESKMTSLDAQRVEQYNNSMVFLVNGPKSLTTHQKMKIRRTYQDGQIPKSYVMITSLPKPPGGFWTKDIPVLDWSVVSTFKVGSKGTSDSTKHNVHEVSGSQTFRAVPDAEKIVYVSPTFFKDDSYYGPKIGSYVKFFNDRGYSFITLATNRHAKFKREHPNSMDLHVAVRHFVKQYNASLSADEMTYLGMKDTTLYRLECLVGVDIADPDVVAWSKKADRTEYNRVHKAREIYTIITRRTSDAGLTGGVPIDPFKNYPLVGCLSTDEIRNHQTHVRDYINAVYNSNRKGN
jgi:hypothetical protein